MAKKSFKLPPPNKYLIVLSLLVVGLYYMMQITPNSNVLGASTSRGQDSFISRFLSPLNSFFKSNSSSGSAGMKMVKQQGQQYMQQRGQNQQGQQGGQQDMQQRKPPQEAFSACSGKTTGTSCSFTTPMGPVSGTCQTPPNETSNVCVPSNATRN